jgi:hypothetical protein
MTTCNKSEGEPKHAREFGTDVPFHNPPPVFQFTTSGGTVIHESPRLQYTPMPCVGPCTVGAAGPLALAPASVMAAITASLMPAFFGAIRSGLNTYDLTSSIGPLSGVPEINPGLVFASTSGNLKISSTSGN